MARQDAPDDILVELDAEGIGDLLGDLAAAEVWVAPFHLDHRVDQLWTDPWVRGDRIVWSYRKDDICA